MLKIHKEALEKIDNILHLVLNFSFIKRFLMFLRESGTKLELTTDSEDIGELISVELFYYGFNSFYIQNVRVNILHRNEM